ncbi:MAG TPA: C2 family cysteine protease [Methanoregulaceae archaeon]|jgi:hypothetical protein|nr:C2 family cysteine protease [Methanolinea sp.]HOS82251.1 C2 family cysteine protease [Methanolinea sp.]HPD11440.1 C2 family cysteine protease [Methanoregulaceae archaeon]HRU80690.1 C2 family cysteine protease [Methanolinea sp.]
MQGAVANCSFMAALSSVAWVSDRIIQNPDSSTQNGIRTWSIPFYTNKIKQFYQVPEKFWLDRANVPYLKFGRSSDLNEIWPAVYEKGYAIYLQKDSCELNTWVWPANPCGPLANLSGWSATCLKTLIESNADPDTIFNTLSSMCNGTPGKGQKTKRPMVGTTRSASNISDPPGTNQILPDHAYTILGVYLVEKNKYVVLRNPTGTRIQNTDNSAALLDGNWGTNVEDYLYQPSGQAIPRKGSIHCIQFDANIGIFALKANKFRDNFNAYYWV